MAKEAKGAKVTESIYQGGYSSMDPFSGSDFANSGWKAGGFSLTTDPRTANQLQSVSERLSTGVKHIELAMVSPQIFDAMPKQQLKEINQLAKLTGAEISMHAPVVDTVGMTQQGFSELNREASERVFKNAIERSHELNPEGNVQVNFHSAEGIPSSEFKPGEEGLEYKKIVAVNQDTGEMIPIKEERKFYPLMHDEKGKIIPLEKGEIISPEEGIRIANSTTWDNQLSQLVFNKERADELLKQNVLPIQHLMQDLQNKKITRETLEKFPEQKQAYETTKIIQSYLGDVNKSVNSLFSRAYEFGNEEQKEALKDISENYKKALEKDPNNVVVQSQAMQELLLNLKSPGMAPEIYVPIDEFAIKQSAKTFGNVAFDSYEKFGDTAPLINIENPPAGFALSTGEALRETVKKSREQFVKKAIEEKNLSRRDAEKIAEKMIGATWDVGHINMMRKQGFETEDIVKETEKIAPFVKHVHLSDNFGLEHTELPMGMGNVPMKEIMQKLGKKGFDAKKVIEAASWWEHVKTPPLKSTLSAFGSEMYSGGPYWSQSLGLQQGYLGGYGSILPQFNYNTFGAGFSQLPAELGGQIGSGGGSRMSGNQME